MNPIQKNLFELLVEIDDFCKKHDIEYILAAGAGLGAVRNHHFLPWDDDIDLYISRENWNKLRHILETEENVLPEGRSFIYKENTPYYCNPLPRYVNNNTTTIYISQALAGKACGQHIEFFIFDPMPVGDEAKEEYLNMSRLYAELLTPYFVTNKNTSLEDWQRHYALYEEYCKRIDKEGYDKVINELEEQLQNYSVEESDEFCMRWGIKVYRYPKKHFFNGDLGLFEGMEFPIGNETEGMLRIAYGDSWMYVPEFEEQISHGGLKNDDLPFSEYTDRYLGKINRETVFEKYKKNKRNNAGVFYNRMKVNMLVAKEKAAVGSMHTSKLDEKEDYLRSLLENTDYPKLSEEFKEYCGLQMIGDVRRFNLMVHITDRNLETLLLSLIQQGRYFDANKYLNVRKAQDKPLTDGLIEIEKLIGICRELSVVRYDEKDELQLQSLIDKYDEEYPDLLDIYRSKIWIMENNAESAGDFEEIDKLCDEALSMYPFDGEIMAFQAKAKLECGNNTQAMELYRKAIDNTRNGLIWQKVEDETGISRLDIERELIEEFNNEV